MNIAYCSPFSPIKSGISDFSEELVMELRKYANIDLFYNIQPNKMEIKNNFKFYQIKELYQKDVFSKYDIIVYHMGNNVSYHKCIAKSFMDLSGVLELHDFSLHNYLAGDTYIHNDIEGYVNCVRYSHGEKGVKIVQDFLNGNARAPWETHSLELSVNKQFIDNAKAIIVHSDMAKQMVKGIRPNVPVINIPLHTSDITEDYEIEKIKAKQKLKINEKTLVLGSFGYQTRAKRILEILEAMSIFRKNSTIDFHYYIVGKVDGIEAERKIKELSLENRVTITGFTDLNEFKTYMGACDIAFNLRYPTQGESSASLHRLLGMGKPVIVTDIGSFQEYPDNVVIKVPYDDTEVLEIYKAICKLIKNSNVIKERGQKAYEYAKRYCNIEINAKKYFDFFTQVKYNKFQDDEIDSFIDKLFDLRLTDNEYINHLFNNKSVGLVLDKICDERKSS